MGTTGAVVEIHELTKKYGRFVALEGLTLSADRGQILGFIGPNGAGKTTTIKILVGLAGRPAASTVGGIDAAEPHKIKRLMDTCPILAYDNMRRGIPRLRRRVHPAAEVEDRRSLEMAACFKDYSWKA